mmetsp:Transcript_48169/g.111591  ORF Transcript_48169/g.111591 Transcript_48169/m.111591 type:complete len:237 (+) Transcript_48169:1385-2095(+)
MCTVRLLCLHLVQLSLELFEQAFQHRHNVVRLELVSSHRRCAILRLPLEERGQHTLHARCGCRHLLQECLGLRSIIGLRRENLDGFLKCFHGFGVVLLELDKLCMLGLTDIGGVLLLRLHPAYVCIEASNFIGQNSHLVVCLLNEGNKPLNAALTSFDFKPKVRGAVADPLLVLRIGLLLRLHASLCFAMHLCQLLENLLHWRDAHPCGCGRGHQKHRAQAAAVHGRRLHWGGGKE